MIKRLLSTLLILLSLIGTAYAQDTKKSALEITDIEGKHYTITGTPEGLKISGLEGKVVFLEFFGHKCPPCLASIPHLIDLQKKHADKLAVVSVEVQGLAEEALKAFAKSKGINYIVISGQKEHLFVNYIAQRAQWQGGIPFLLALDGKGDVHYIQPGLIPEEMLEDIFQQLSKVK